MTDHDPRNVPIGAAGLERNSTIVLAAKERSKPVPAQALSPR